MMTRFGGRAGRGGRAAVESSRRRTLGLALSVAPRRRAGGTQMAVPAALPLSGLAIVLGLVSWMSCGSTRTAAIGPAAAPPPRLVAQIEHRLIGECSGIVWLDGAWFVHNDSGDAATVYRSRTCDFSDVEILPLRGALARDWEDIAVLDGDLLVGDIGDNRRQRSDLMLYRARYRPVRAAGAAQGRLEMVAACPVRYPDGPHDAEGLAVIDGQVVIVSKARGEGFTGVYRFDRLLDRAELPAGEANVPRKIGTLDLREGEQVTAADFDPRSRLLLVLTYERVLAWPADRLSGPPVRGLEVDLKQCEAICVTGDRLVITNENREVYAIDDFVRALPWLAPPPEPSSQPAEGRTDG